jgi:hypothetical protein
MKKISSFPRKMICFTVGGSDRELGRKKSVILHDLFVCFYYVTSMCMNRIHVFWKLLISTEAVLQLELVCMVSFRGFEINIKNVTLGSQLNVHLIKL